MTWTEQAQGLHRAIKTPDFITAYNQDHALAARIDEAIKPFGV